MYTIATAAAAVGRAKTAIMRAIDAGKFSRAGRQRRIAYRPRRPASRLPATADRRCKAADRSFAAADPGREIEFSLLAPSETFAEAEAPPQGGALFFGQSALG